MDNELKKQAEDWAKKVINEIRVAINDPTIGLKDEAINVYKELKDWDWLTKFNISLIENDKVFIPLIAEPKYKTLLSNKLNPPKPKLSKWEVVTGQRLKKVDGLKR
jgi:hypothetical protein